MREARSVVVITGASAGVGRAAARRFGDEGASVALLARGPERLEEAARELRARGSSPAPLRPISPVMALRPLRSAAEGGLSHWNVGVYTRVVAVRNDLIWNLVRP